ncbi:MAG TPA: CRTAC1 family protein [Pirellulaceae bacterium]|nr:CRTAC1 family protein [Pirellulaceae bacterium]
MTARRALALCGIAAVFAVAAYGLWRYAFPTPSASRAKSTSVNEAPPLFEEITSTTGIDFQHWCGDGGKFYFPEVMGSGIALFDYDRDGYLDLFVVQGMPAITGGADRSTGKQPAKASASSRLYRQEKDGRFVDVTEEAGLMDEEPYGMGVAVGDVNNDGWPDLYVTKFGRDRLFLNRQGRFEDITASAGIDNPRWGTSVCFIDYDRDGWLDIFVTNYVDYYPSQRCIEPNGSEDYCHPGEFSPAPAKLYRNVTATMAPSGSESENEGVPAVRFQDVSFEMGIDGKPGPGLGVVPGDFNGDGWPDLYVANDAAANFLWINQQGSKFVDEAVVGGAACDIAGKPQSSMGVASGDINGDGMNELFTTHLDGEYSTLYVQLAAASFEDRTARAGLAGATIPFTGFGTAFLDMDLDGNLDLAIANGRVRRPDRDRAPPADPAAFWRAYAEPNQLFLGDGKGGFALVASAQPFCAEPHVARGLAVGDLDNDGDLDLVTSEINGPLRVFRNVAPRAGNWLMVAAIDPQRGGRDAYGAVLTVEAGGKRWSRDINPAYSYLSSNDPRAHFGLGQVDSVDRIIVRWPDGSEESFAGGPANRLVTVRQGEGNPP